MTCQACIPAVTAYFAAMQVAVAGGNFGDIAIAAATAYATASISMSLGAEGYLPQEIFAVSVVGGLSSLLNGGKFGHGFVSAGVGTVAGQKLAPVAGETSNNVAKGIAGMVVAGTVSEATGGKFANGAAYAAFSWAVSAGVTNSQKKLSGGTAPDSGASVDIEALKARTSETLERLREFEEIQMIEKEHGPIELTFDQSQDTGIRGNVVNINASRLEQSFIVDLEGSKAAFFGLERHSSLSDAEFNKVIENFEQGLTEIFKFSLERTLVHEINHLSDPSGSSGIQYKMFQPSIERSVIRRTNEFMLRNFNEPYRVLNHGAVTN